MFFPFRTITEKFPYYEDTQLGVKYIELPYYRNGASLVLTLPTKSMTDFVTTMTVTTFTDLNMKKRMKLVKVSIPKFSVQCSYDMSRAFKLMGVKDVLDDTSDLGTMTDDKNFRVSEGLLACAIRTNFKFQKAQHRRKIAEIK